MIDHIRTLAIFAKVAEAGSFRGAARVLGISPSVVSQNISVLETRLGAALIYRSTRKFSLTPDGERLLGAANAMVQAAESGLSQFSGVSTEPVGVLRIAVPAALVSEPFIRIFKGFADENPGVALRISFSDLRRDIIGEGFDMAFRAGWLTDSSLKATRVGEIRRQLVASPRYVTQHNKPRTPADLEDWRFIRFESLSEGIELEHPREGKAIVRGTTQISVDSSEAMHRFALADAGVASLLGFAVKEDIAAGRLVELLPGWQLATAGIYAVWPPNAPRQGLTSKMVSYLRSNLELS